MYEFCRFFLGVIFIYARALVASQIELSKWLLIDNGATVCVRIYAKMIRNKVEVIQKNTIHQHANDSLLRCHWPRIKSTKSDVPN